MLKRVAALFEDVDVLVCPCVMVPPFDVRLRYGGNSIRRMFMSAFDA